MKTNNMIGNVDVTNLNKEEKQMITLNEQRELLQFVIEVELSQEVVDMVQVGDYEEELASVEWAIIQLLDKEEDRLMEEELQMREEMELEGFEDRLTLETTEEEKEMQTTKLGFYEEGLHKEYGRPTEVNYSTNAELTFVNDKIVSVRPFSLVDTKVGGGTIKVYREAFDVDSKEVGVVFEYRVYEQQEEDTPVVEKVDYSIIHFEEKEEETEMERIERELKAVEEQIEEMTTTKEIERVVEFFANERIVGFGAPTDPVDEYTEEDGMALVMVTSEYDIVTSSIVIAKYSEDVEYKFNVLLSEYKYNSNLPGDTMTFDDIYNRSEKLKELLELGFELSVEKIDEMIGEENKKMNDYLYGNNDGPHGGAFRSYEDLNHFINGPMH